MRKPTFNQTKQILAILLVVLFVATVTAPAAVAAAAASKIKEYYGSRKNKEKSKKMWIFHTFPYFKLDRFLVVTMSYYSRLL